jgi:protein tyrosine phosphatase
MVWQYDVEVIVMVTLEFEKGRMKCHRYWCVENPITASMLCVRCGGDSFWLFYWMMVMVVMMMGLNMVVKMIMILMVVVMMMLAMMVGVTISIEWW